MRIVIDLTSISYHLSGIERYAMCITDKLIDIDKKNTYFLIFRNEIPSTFVDRIDGNRINAKVLTGNNKLIFLQFTLRKALQQIKADKYLFFAFPSPVFLKRKGIINTIHDMGAWDSSQEMKFLSKWYFRLSYRRAAAISEKIITVSNFSKDRIVSILNVPYKKVVVISSAVNETLNSDSVVSFSKVKKQYNIPEKYIMTLSTLEPRKNIKLLLEVFDRLADKVDYDLVLVGRKGWKIDNILQEYHSKNRIHITGFIEDDYLSSVYKNAMCFVFPSLYEGFGLPPIEALSLGTPVLSSDAASLPEVLMDRAIYFKSNDSKSLEAILISLDNKLENMPKCLNDYQIENFSFDTSARKVFEQIINCN